ncbi:TIGR03826 family flagellar region protein [Texcoconibacillus texcoconensis]|uniref:Flagellar operon protein (TIGR03826 family) n=1 Tax=Texcoconibacillus texcoconensis TaxID=1095777 RepID=A0A840QQX2_9BACI|nr:TIGR03826 family flagellar region protein [Texcoconibacillus texcoconensis]MBB5173765.1 flagellar operon protein (TIGR03826 family) [Texcoconibacillus texcoconensis]
MGELANCPRCGEVFVKALRSVCSNCYQEVEEMFRTVFNYIRKRENRTATMRQVVEGTGVSEDQIIRFIKEGRLKLSQFPNLTYPCESCGSEIREGRICESCRTGIKSDLKHEEDLKAVEERQKQEERDRNRTYHSLNGKINRPKY